VSLSGKIRVLVVDDSALMRKLIPQVLHRDPTIEVVGTAMDGEMGLKKIAELHPHVVTLDLDMPRMDGIEMLRQITRKHHVPVILKSSVPRRIRLRHQATRRCLRPHRAYCR
jgi:two-component system chemotaxis response regulator CheB